MRKYNWSKVKMNLILINSKILTEILHKKFKPKQKVNKMNKQLILLNIKPNKFNK